MSINAIGATTPWWAAQASAASAVTSDAAAASSATASTNASGLGNFFQQFATDLQSLLTQVQATSGGTTAPATTTPATTSAAATTADATSQTSTQQTNGASTLATDIVQVLQNYGAFANNPATSTVSTTA